MSSDNVSSSISLTRSNRSELPSPSSSSSAPQTASSRKRRAIDTPDTPTGSTSNQSPNATEPNAKNKRWTNSKNQRDEPEKEKLRKFHEAEQFVEDNEYEHNGFPHRTTKLALRAFLDLSVRNGETSSIKYLPEADDCCIICRDKIGPDNDVELIPCHGQMSGEMEAGLVIPLLKRPFRPCRSMFHKNCISDYNDGGFDFQYAARAECQGLLLCPLHCCQSCNLSRCKQSAYEPGLVECALCLRAYHLENCLPIGSRIIEVSLLINNREKVFQMLICHAHRLHPAPIRANLDICCSESCQTSRASLVECTTCIKSFHRSCRKIKKFDGRIPGVSKCDSCLSDRGLIFNQVVVVLDQTTETTCLARTLMWSNAPTSMQQHSNYKKEGFVLVKCLLGKDQDIYSIVPAGSMDRMREKYHILFKDKQFESSKTILRSEKEGFLKWCPPPQKSLYSRGDACIFYSTNTRRPIEYEESGVCGCVPPNRCTTVSCPYVRDNMECPPDCGVSCNNRKVSRSYVNPNIKVFVTSWKGLGIVATADLKKDEVLAEYVGELIDKEELNKRQSIVRQSRDRQAQHYLMSLNQGWSIDSCRFGNIARYINHSCRPNSVAQPIGTFLSKRGDYSYYDSRIVFKTIEDVPKGTELTICYDMAQNETVPPCSCQASNCDLQMTKKPDSFNSL